MVDEVCKGAVRQRPDERHRHGHAGSVRNDSPNDLIVFISFANENLLVQQFVDLREEPLGMGMDQRTERHSCDSRSSTLRKSVASM